MAQDAKYLSYNGLKYFWNDKVKPIILENAQVTALALTDLNYKLNTHTHTVSQLTDFPESLKNPEALTIQCNNITRGVYDGSAAITVNITARSVGALPLTGGLMTGTITSQNIIPSVDNTYNLGSSSLKWANVHATTFTGNLSGNASGAGTIKIYNSPNTGHYPLTFVSNTSTGNQALYVSTGESLTFNPSAGILTAKTFKGDLSGNALSASKLGSSTIGNSKIPIFLSSGVPKQCSGIADTFVTHDLVYNDYNAAAKLSPIQLAASNFHSPNRLAFARPAGITVEYSTDGGTTWIDYGLTDNEKIKFITHVDGFAVYAGKKLSTTASSNDKLRITLHATNLGLYTRATNLLINMSSNGSVCNESDGSADNCIKVDIERSKRGSEGEFTLTTTNVRLAGWSGWNNIPMDQISFGGGSTQTHNTGAIRLTFYSDGAGSSYSSGAHFCIMNLYLIGSTYWNTPSKMSRTGHLYDYDVLQDMILPKDLIPETHNAGQIGWNNRQWAAICANNFYENGTPLIDKYATSSHEHSADDITSGILPVDRGGTGLSTITTDHIMIGNSDGTLTTTKIVSITNAEIDAICAK